MSKGDGVVVELEGVGVGQRDGEHWQELLHAEAGEHLRQRDERGEELQNGDGDVDRGRDLTTNKFSIHAMSFLFLISDQAPQLQVWYE